MLASDSILRRLPPGLSPKDAIFIDGIRHAIEIGGFAYTRLESTLTTLALQQAGDEARAPDLITSAFLDAWAIVDAFDRLRSLLRLFPGAKAVPNTGGGPSLAEAIGPLRDLRNVADHLAQRVEYVFAKKSTALGILSWATVIDGEAGTVRSCSIVPGTITDGARPLVNPAGKAFESRTGFITLEAGEYSASLTVARDAIRARIPGMEDSLSEGFEAQGVAGKAAGADLVLSVTMQFIQDTDPPESAA